MGTSLDRCGNQYQIEHLHQHVYHPENLVKIGLVVSEISLLQAIVKKLEIWANAQRDGRPAEYMWHPLFNAAKFG